MITAIALWLVLQVPLGIAVGKILKASPDPVYAKDDSPATTPITAAPSAAELLTRGACPDVVV
jgi:hypothetical protein